MSDQPQTFINNPSDTAAAANAATAATAAANAATAIAVVSTNIEFIKKDVTEIKSDVKEMKQDYVTRREHVEKTKEIDDKISFQSKIIYGGIGLVLIAVITAALRMIIK